MNRKKEKGLVLEQKLLAPGIYDLRILCEAAREARAGQFVMVYPKDPSTLLPRPISICQYDREYKWIRLVYRVVGKGTAEFSGYEAGDDVYLLGPIGNGFPVEEAVAEEKKTALLLAGGIGIPPIVGLAVELKDKAKLVIGAGYRDSRLFLAQDLAARGQLHVSTDDGSAGIKGTVIDAVRASGVRPDVIYACGPMPMLRGVKAYAAELDVPAYISLEERMACGVGACLGCVCTTVETDHHSHVKNARVCTEGPVFPAWTVEI